MAISVRFGYDPSEVRLGECTAAEAVGNFVYIISDPPDGQDIVRKADPTDYDKLPAVGVIISKPTSTTCLVQWFGETPDIFSGLSTGEIHFLGTDSNIADVPPTPSGSPVFSQIVAVATAPTRAYIKPNEALIKRIP